METKTYKADTAHSTIGFNVKHMMFSKVAGQFDDYTATVEMAGENFEDAKLEFDAEAGSVNTQNEDRDKHLRSAEFFNAENNTRVQFASTEITKKDGNKYEVKGDLTMNGITKPVVLDAEYSGIMKDPWGNDRIALIMDGKVNRHDWEINWNQTLETGGVMVSKNVNFEINAQFI